MLDDYLIMNWVQSLFFIFFKGVGFKVKTRNFCFRSCCWFHAFSIRNFSWL